RCPAEPGARGRAARWLGAWRIAPDLLARDDAPLPLRAAVAALPRWRLRHAGAPGAPGPDARGQRRCLLRAARPRLARADTAGGLRAHRPRQGAAGARGHLPSRPAERAPAAR